MTSTPTEVSIQFCVIKVFFYVYTDQRWNQTGGKFDQFAVFPQVRLFSIYRYKIFVYHPQLTTIAVEQSSSQPDLRQFVRLHDRSRDLLIVEHPAWYCFFYC